MTLKTCRLRDKLLEGHARSLEFPFVGNEPRNLHGEQEFCGRRRAPFRVRRWRVGTIEGRVDLRTSKQPGVALEMRPCRRTTMCGQSRNRPTSGPDVNPSSHGANAVLVRQAVSASTQSCPDDGRNAAVPVILRSSDHWLPPVCLSAQWLRRSVATMGDGGSPNGTGRLHDPGGTGNTALLRNTRAFRRPRKKCSRQARRSR